LLTIRRANRKANSKEVEVIFITLKKHESQNMSNLKTVICSLWLCYTGFSQESKPVFIKELNVCIKAGTTVNLVNNAIYSKLNEGFITSKYTPNNVRYFINPYVSVGIENHFLKKVGLLFNVGFCQTAQQTSTYNNSLTSSSTAYSTACELSYLNNNVFVEVLPEYIFKHTKFFGGINGMLTSPTVLSKTTFTELSTQKVTVTYEKDKPNESYHIYSILGITQGIPIKSSELTITLSYFGLAKKYDSGINLALGVAF